MSEAEATINLVDYDDIKTSIELELGETPLGWSGIVTELFEQIKARSDEIGIDYPKVLQIKQKFGELRIYFSKASEDERIRGWVAATIDRANQSCERCGNAARPQNLESWIMTLCCWCAHEEAARRFNEHKRRYFRRTDAPEHLTCSVCGYVGHIDRSDDRRRCPCCVKKGW
ncbi:hypothetical protein [Ruegeria atlantica]|uniref:hypothetical protein n=1 Tax=Ruegeria atlantica TaxID=81569 RepID=UPI00147A564D|nr:hypothetical protein [Ruegeria atlantica]